jgi:transposase
MGPVRFEAAVRRQLPRWGTTRPCLWIVLAALGDPSGVAAVRLGVLERVHLVQRDRQQTGQRLVETEQRMVAVLDELGLTDLVARPPPPAAEGSPSPSTGRSSVKIASDRSMRQTRWARVSAWSGPDGR